MEQKNLNTRKPRVIKNVFDIDTSLFRSAEDLKAQIFGCCWKDRIRQLFGKNCYEKEGKFDVFNSEDIAKSINNKITVDATVDDTTGYVYKVTITHVYTVLHEHAGQENNGFEEVNEYRQFDIYKSKDGYKIYQKSTDNIALNLSSDQETTLRILYNYCNNRVYTHHTDPLLYVNTVFIPFGMNAPNIKVVFAWESGIFSSHRNARRVSVYDDGSDDEDVRSLYEIRYYLILPIDLKYN
jgi:hypothetical protein